MLKLGSISRRGGHAGFSLLELAIVLLVVSLLLGGLLISLSATQESGRRSDTEDQLSQVVEALYGFAQATGRLPCPASAASGGLEAPVGGGVCTQQHGFVPSTTLGLTGSVNADGLLLDAWGSPLRYSVTLANGGAFTAASGMRNATMAVLAPDLRVCGSAACGAVVVDAVPAVVVSLGADWASFDAADVDEIENAGETTINGYRHAADNDFVQTDYIEDSFDDLLLWLSPSVLYTRMIAAGQLP